jgi:tRNA threonylcarbamoyladenosine biosynthesis protein TsaE
MNELVLTLKNESDTESAGSRLAPLLFSGAFVALYGDLGSGKTTFTRGVASGLGIFDVMSPTFTIVREHKDILFHFDAYRLSGPDELYDAGFLDYLSRGGVIVMEWAENVRGALPEERLDILIEGSGEAPRTLRMIPRGERYEAVVCEYRKA